MEYTSHSKIAFFLPSLASGGAQRVQINLSSELRKSGLDIDIVLSRATGELLPEVPDDIRVIDFKKKHVAQCLPQLIFYIRNEKPKIIISAIEHANVVAILANKLALTNTRTIITLHTNITAAIENRTTKTVKTTILPLFVKKLYPLADKIVAVSKGVAEDFEKFLDIDSNMIKTIYNPVVNDEVSRRSSEKVEHPWFLPGSPPVIISIGRLSEQKDYTTLLKAFAEVNKFRNARLLIIGEGPERSYLKKIIADYGIQDTVQMLGFKSNPYPYLLKSSALVLSSKAEGLPTVLIEALALGVPIISSDCKSGPAEILEGGKLGVLVPVENHIALAEEIILLIDNLHQRKKTALQNKDKVDRYSLRSSVMNYLELINSLKT